LNATEVQVIARLVVLLRLCRRERISFRQCHLQALAQWQKETREDALNRALD